MGQTGNKEVTLGQTREGSGRQGNEMKTKDRLKKIREGWVTEIIWVSTGKTWESWARKCRLWVRLGQTREDWGRLGKTGEGNA